MIDNWPTRYDHKAHEEKIYKLWEESGYFNPNKLPGDRKSAFTIIMPPPNANGPLHAGHAYFVTLEDIMIRYQRMRGRKVLWLPGADHAGFETQVVFDKKLEKEGRSRFQMPRDQLWQEMWEFTQQNKKVMEGQLRKLGASCDWSRERFTLDPEIIKIVKETFVKLYNDGLAYRAARLVNWCVKHQTTLSDLEIRHEHREDFLYYVRYPLSGLANEWITVATARPETIPADVAIAVHPRTKWKKYFGQKVLNPLTGKAIPVITDLRVDPKFGTGALKITPLHDSLDWEIYEEHKNEIKAQPISVIDQRGRLTPEAGPELVGLKVAEARAKAAELLKDKLDQVPAAYQHQVAVCYKCGMPIEPILKAQWFIKMTEPPKGGGQSLRDAAVKAVKSGQIKFATKKFEKIFLHWMKNLRDWNVSRQIVWGIQIPAWFRNSTTDQEVYVGINPPSGSDWQQDSDVFDTWFSSGQWPFAALKAGSEADFESFYPTDVMETGHDILFFWVARMIMLGLYVTGKPPFERVYLHGLLRDKDRQKMSKSKGNAIDPLGVAEIYGTDALRMAFVIGATAGNDPIMSEEKIRGYRNFATKIWNVSRFIAMNYKKSSVQPEFTAEDKKRLKELRDLKKKVTKYLDKLDFNHAGGTLYHYFWHTFADKILESAKSRLKPETAAESDRAASQTVLLAILFECLKMLHPFMPYLTEEIYQRLTASGAEGFVQTGALPPGVKNVLMISEWGS